MSATLVREEIGAPAMITPFSRLGAPVEKMKWWAPFGWLFVAVFTILVFSIIIAMVPVMLLVMIYQRLFIKSRYKYHRNPGDLRIAIIGGGWGGMQALERFKKHGVENVDVFERYDDIGGTWHKNLRYQGLQLHGNMTVTSFDGFPYSKDKDVQGGKVMGEEVERYIHRYADAHGLRRHCLFHSNVDAVNYRSDNRTGTLNVTDTVTGEKRETAPYDMVIWASMAAFGNIPKIKNSEQFKGQQLHTTGYKREQLDDILEHNKKVVVVGGGKGACDVVLSLKRAGHKNFIWVMRKPYLFYKFETLLHDASFKNQVRGLSYLATVMGTGLSSTLGAMLHWSSGYVYTFGKGHTDFNHFHGGVLCPTQRKDLLDVAYTIGEPVDFTKDKVILKDGTELDCDVVIWATGNTSGIDTLKINKDGLPFKLEPKAKLFNHFIVPQIPVLASSTALWTTFGPMRAANSADVTVHHLCVRKERSEEQMQQSAKMQWSNNSLTHSFIWAQKACWLQQWVYFHFDLMKSGITPIESFFKHAIEIFVLSKETPLELNLLPKKARVPAINN